MAKLNTKGNTASNTSQSTSSPSTHTPLPTQQFGVSLQFIKEHNGGVVIPPIVQQCVQYLSTPDGQFGILVCYYKHFLVMNSIGGWLCSLSSLIRFYCNSI